MPKDPFVCDVISYYIRMGQQPVFFTIYFVKVAWYKTGVSAVRHQLDRTHLFLLPDHLRRRQQGSCGRNLSDPSRNGVFWARPNLGLSERWAGHTWTPRRSFLAHVNDLCCPQTEKQKKNSGDVIGAFISMNYKQVSCFIALSLPRMHHMFSRVWQRFACACSCMNWHGVSV